MRKRMTRKRRLACKAGKGGGEGGETVGK